MKLWSRLMALITSKDRKNSVAMEQLTAKFEAEFAHRRDIERELAHLASFAELDPNIILETDLEGRVLYQNIVANEEFGDLRSTKKPHPLIEGFKGVVEVLQKQQKPLLTRPVKVGGRVFNQQIALIENGTRLRSYVTDVTELKRLDQLKTEFVNMASHELRTPLTSLQAVVRMLHSGMLGPLNDDQKKSLGMAVNSIDRLRRLITNLLDVSKIEAGKMDLHRQWVHLNGVAEELHAGFLPLAQERGVDLKLSVPAVLPPVFVDRDKIVEVLTNLIQNAMKFTSNGAVELSMNSDDESVTCSVADSGPGISAADLPKLFGQFQQIGNQLGSAEKGTGLGLSICKGLVELHQGRIWAQSEPGKGARFSFRLPRLTPEDLFQTTVRGLFDEAVASSKPLSVATFTFQEMNEMVNKLGLARVDLLMNRLESLVKAASRHDTDPVVKTATHVWLAMTGADLAEAREIAERVEQFTLELSFQELARVPVTLDYRLVCYPENASMVEQLLNLSQIGS